MAQDTLTIDGKAYRMACEEGQENHLSELADKFDRYVSHLKTQFGEIGDLRITVMAGIMVMDELSDVGRRLAKVEGELNRINQNRDDDRAATARTEEMLAAMLEELTARIQGIATRLNARPAPEA